jgi:hypothetical protein
MNKLDYIKLTYDGIGGDPTGIDQVSSLPDPDQFRTVMFDDRPYALSAFPVRYRIEGSHYVVYVRIDCVTEEYFRRSGFNTAYYDRVVEFLLGGFISKI